VRHRIGLLATAAATGAIAFSLVSTGTLPPASAARAAEEHSLAADALQVSSAIQQLNDPASEQNAASPQAASAVAQSQARAQALLAAAQQEAAAAQAAAAAAQSAAAQSAAAQSAGPAAAAPAAPTADSGSAGPDAYRAYARGKVGSAQFGCLDALWKKESGWRPSAKNPGSTAYGIPQLLNATWAATGIARTPNGYRQVDAGLIYIEAAYGTPCAAWSHSKGTGWY
jgi:hypothetical protein